MRFLSVCSGIEAASVAWQPLGWAAIAFAEVDRFPSAVLAHHYPDVPNYGDVMKFKDWPDATVDVLVGGTPCQSFSVAGLRAGLADPRGNLALTYLAVLDRYRPRWMVWENVPGVLSSGGGRDFGTFLGGLGQLGYGFAYRVLDAQYFGLAQRRKRVFVVGYLGDWRRAAAVLFERASLSGHPAPSREAGEDATYDVAPSIGASGRGFSRAGDTRGQDCVIPERARTLTSSNQRNDYETETLIPHALRADGFDASEDGTGRGTPIVPIAFSAQDHGNDCGFDIAPTMRAQAESYTGGNVAVAFVPAVAVALRGRGGGATAELSKLPSALRASTGGGDKAHVLNAMRVRRLTPVECCRLQGFPDDYLDITYRGKPAADGNKYKALGNSMAVPVVRWIGERIALVERAAADLERTA